MRCLLFFLFGFLASCQTSNTQFALIGDNPYQDYNFPKYERLIDDINSRTLQWVLHVGDMKAGGANCSDENLKAIKRINQRFEAPFIVTPGDNDWFDCARQSAGAFDRRERLDRLREIFFSNDLEMNVIRQADGGEHTEYVENLLWIKDEIVYGTVHLVGVTGREGGLDIHNEVMLAGVDWLEKIFGEAERVNAKGIFIATQADLYPLTVEPHLAGAICPRCPLVRPYYETFHEALIENLRRFDKPVVLAVGDTHIFRVDKPIYDNGKLIEHFTRVETFGEDQVHWVRVTVDIRSREVFSFHQEIIPENRGVGWAAGDRELLRGDL